MEVQLARIRANHEAIRNASSDLRERVFGARGHRFALNPPASPEQVERFESTYSITLPEEYRRFVLEVADGGAGPFYGVYRLWSAMHEGEGRRYAKPCVLREELEGFGEEWMSRIGILDWEDRWSADDDFPYHGTLTLSQHGCSGYEILVLNGPERGLVYGISLDGWVPPGISRFRTFLNWYEGWQDTVLGRLERTGFGF